MSREGPPSGLWTAVPCGPKPKQGGRCPQARGPPGRRGDWAREEGDWASALSRHGLPRALTRSGHRRPQGARAAPAHGLWDMSLCPHSLASAPGCWASPGVSTGLGAHRPILSSPGAPGPSPACLRALGYTRALGCGACAGRVRGVCGAQASWARAGRVRGACGACGVCMRGAGLPWCVRGLRGAAGLAGCMRGACGAQASRGACGRVGRVQGVGRGVAVPFRGGAPAGAEVELRLLPARGSWGKGSWKYNLAESKLRLLIAGLRPRRVRGGGERAQPGVGGGQPQGRRPPSCPRSGALWGGGWEPAP